MTHRLSIDSTEGLLDEEKAVNRDLYPRTACTAKQRSCRRTPRCLVATAITIGIILIILGVYAIRSDAATPSHQVPRPSRITEYDLPIVTALRARLEAGLDSLARSSKADKSAWPKRIWQTWKDNSLPELRGTWSELNTDWDYQLMLDGEAEGFVYNSYAQVLPELWSLWQDLNMPVLRADLFRYLVLYVRGGVYADVDVRCARNISGWLSEAQWSDRDAHTITGIELDEPDAPEEKLILRHWTRSFGFVQYAMAAKPFSPVLREVIIRTVLRLHYIAHVQKVASPANITWSGLEVLYATGPEAWTQAVLDCLDPVQDPEVTWRQQISNIKQPTLRGGVIVMPINAFAAGQLHSGSLPVFLNSAVCLVHQGLGSWKTKAKEAWQTSLPTFRQIVSIIDDLFRWIGRSISSLTYLVSS